MKKNTIRLCPQCKKAKLELYGGFVTGSYRCMGCGYVGPIFIEQDTEKTAKKKKS